jgi:hypothetical protein
MKTLDSLLMTLILTGTPACSSAVQDLGNDQTSADAAGADAGALVDEGGGDGPGTDVRGDLDAALFAPDGWDDFDAASVATSVATPPWGVWSMSVQYGPVGVAVTPTTPMQIEIRPDGTAYRWTCVGAPSDGSLTQPCAAVARAQCLTGTEGWDGARWRVDFPAIDTAGLSDQGNITPDGSGDILITYIDPSYSGALFRKVGTFTVEGPACTP